MAQKMYLINSPEFSEYVFYVLSTTPKESLLTLTSKELAYFKDLKTMRRFADNETLEKRLLLLAKLEVPFCLVVGKRKPVDTVLEQVYTQYRYLEKRKALIDAMAREKMFVLSSNEVLLGLHMAAQNSHSRVYVLNYDYVKMNQKLLDTGNVTVNQDVQDAKNGFDILSRATLVTTVMFDKCQQMFGIGPFSMQILLAVFPFRNTFISAHKIYEIMDVDPRSRGIVKTCTELERDGYLKPLPGFDEQRNRLKTYTISEKGINVAMQFLKYVSSKSLYGLKN